MKLTAEQRDWIEIAVYIFLGYLIAVGLNKGLTYGLNTDYPVVAVVSTSMEHLNAEQTHYSFFKGKNFTMNEIKSLPFKDGIRKGDIVIVRGVPFDKLKAGDVVVYRIGGKEPIIHRVVETNKGELITKGDNNNNPDQRGANIAPPLKAGDIKGKAIIRVPLLGYVKIIYLKLIGKGQSL